MNIRKLQRVIVDALENVKAQHIRVFNTEEQSALFERVIVASGTSSRQTKALSSSVRDAVKAEGFDQPRVEGEENGEWIIVDCGAAVVHVMQPAMREYYHLEEIWGAKLVRMKLGDAPSGLVKAALSSASPVGSEQAQHKVVPKVRKVSKVASKQADAPSEPAEQTPRKRVPRAPSKPAVKSSTRLSAAKKVAATGLISARKSSVQ